MIIGRREDYFDKIKRACGAWQRQDGSLSISTSGKSIFLAALEAAFVVGWQN